MTSRRRAFISVSDKTGLDRFALLAEAGWEIISSGGTAEALRKHNIEVTPVEKVTNMREMMSGRLKTVHPMIFGAIIADRAEPSHMEDVEREGMGLIDLVVVNFYDYHKNPKIDNIDVGGPTNVAAAAKNYLHVTVVTDPSDYPQVMRQLVRDRDTTLALRELLAAQAFRMIGKYYTDIAKHMDQVRV
jgi:phosphoribosylaminoimidazolecarboxamide formyltransferase/IMP cyclohydrolase